MPEAMSEGETLSLLVRCIDASHRRREWLRVVFASAVSSFALGVAVGVWL